MAVKNPFAQRKTDGRIIMITDLTSKQSGKACGCICPECKSDFIARMGEVRIPHFAHNGEACDSVKAFMSALYQIMVEGLQDNPKFITPEWHGSLKNIARYNKATPEQILTRCTFSKYSFENSQQIINRTEFEVCSTEILQDSKGMPKALLLTESTQKHQLAIVIIPPPTLCKVPKAKPIKGFSTLAINMANDLNIYQKNSNSMKEILLRGTQYKDWISSPKIDKWLSTCLSNQHKQHEQWQKEEAERQKERNKRLQAIQNQENFTQSQPSHQKQRCIAVHKSPDMIRQIIKDYQDNNRPVEANTNYNDPDFSSMRSYLSKNIQQIPDDRDIIDDKGRRWCFCDSCKEWFPETYMTIYGGLGDKRNRGTCRYCISLK